MSFPVFTEKALCLPVLQYKDINVWDLTSSVSPVHPTAEVSDAMHTSPAAGCVRILSFCTSRL